MLAGIGNGWDSGNKAVRRCGCCRRGCDYLMFCVSNRTAPGATPGAYAHLSQPDFRPCLSEQESNPSNSGRRRPERCSSRIFRY